eukprot:gene7568-8368_t
MSFVSTLKISPTLHQGIRRLSSAKTASGTATATATRSSLSNGGFWQPFTDHQRLRDKGHSFSRAEGVYYYTSEGDKKLYDAMSGLWCVNAGHCHPKIVEAVQKQVAKLDYAPTFNTSHDLGHVFAEKVLSLLPNRGFQEVFYTLCGSSAVDTSMKIALAYHRARGHGEKVRFIGRERGYHGVGFGGISVGGILPNRKVFSSALLPFVDHLPHTHSLKDMAFSRGQPDWGAHLADELEKLVAFHDASTIAAVIVEPVAGSTGVLPPPKGYLEKIREICTKHNILLIFDEVITGFGRLGSSFATERFNLTPDIITCAKGLTNATVPAGAVICQGHIFDSIYSAAHANPGVQMEFFHGYTYSGHPLAMAAGIATLDVYKEEGLFERAAELEPYLEAGLHSLRDLPHVIDIRNLGLMGAIELAPLPGAPTKRAFDVFDRCFNKGVFVRVSGSAVVMSPPLISEKRHIDKLIDALKESIIDSAKHL